jgi:Kdo2-lipid IVA lauroyltransferase/acyltransferase
MSARHALEYAALVALASAARVLPRRTALALGAGIGELGWLLRVRRGLVLANLAQARPGESPGERRRIAARAARNFGRTVVEFVRFPGRDRRRLGELVSLTGLEAVRAALDRGQGALVITAHLGSWALYVTALAGAGVPSALLVGRQHNEKVDRFILGIPGEAVRFISKGPTAPRVVLHSLRDNLAVVMVADQDAGDQGVLAPFLGRVASTLPLPGAIAARHATPLFVMTGHRVDSGRHDVRLAPLPVPHGASADLVTAAFNEALGVAIAAHPEHYFWYHRRWRDYPATGERRQAIATATSAPTSPSATPQTNENGR